MKRGRKIKIAMPRYNRFAYAARIKQLKGSAPNLISLNDNRHNAAHQEARGPRYGKNRKMWSRMKVENRRIERRQNNRLTQQEMI
jgi:hypothetical protein